MAMVYMMHTLVFVHDVCPLCDTCLCQELHKSEGAVLSLLSDHFRMVREMSGARFRARGLGVMGRELAGDL